MLPPFSIHLTSEGRLGRTPLLHAEAPAPEDEGTASISGGAPFAEKSFAELELSAYRSALDQANGNVSAAARLLKISRPKLDYRLRRLGLRPGI